MCSFAAELGRYTAAGRCKAHRSLPVRGAPHHIWRMSDPAFDYRGLPIPERLQLVEDIWDSIAQEANVRPDVLPLTEAQRAELLHRLDDADAHPEDAIPWDRVRAELFKRGG